MHTMQRYALTALAIATSAVFASPAANELPQPHPRELQKRGNIVTASKDEYDFVVVGGGLAGLVMGNRLSADSGNSVLVLEAGSSGEEYAELINTPGLAYYGDLWDLPINWAFQTTPQEGLNGYKMPWPRGKVLGGSSAINGMYMTRPNEEELTAWNKMLGGMDGADNWTWDSFFAAMKKSETFTPPPGDIAKEGDITWVASSHGTSGPIHHTWPGVTFPLIGAWSQAAANAGLPDTKDAYGGQNDGAYVATSCISPIDWTRSYSKSGYLDPLPERENYDVLTNAQATKILFDTSGENLLANGVEYAVKGNGGTVMKTVKVKKEVVLSGGSVGSPNVLMHSGIGPAPVLNAAGVKVLHNLPGVGEHLQDHLSIQTQWHTTQETAGEMYADGDNDPAFLSYVNDAIGFPNAKTLGISDLGNFVMSNLKNPSTDKTVNAGYEAIIKTQVEMLSGASGQIELLLGNDLNNATVRIQCTIQHPYSQGRITIGSNDPLDYPIIDPQYLSHPADVEILVAGLKLARKIGEAEPFNNILTETYPGKDVQSDADWEKWLRKNGFTEFHPCSTCAMLPLEQGGVVDANLIVYGTSNVRVADASVPPIEFSAHLMASTYGVAERASEIILEYYKSGGTVDGLGSKAKSGSGSGSSSSGAAGIHEISSFVTVVVGITALAFTFL